MTSKAEALISKGFDGDNEKHHLPDPPTETSPRQLKIPSLRVGVIALDF